MSDRRLVYVAALMRAFATGLIGVLLGLYLDRIRIDAAGIGAVIAAGLAGAATATLAVTLGADRLGRRRVLMALAILSALGAAAMLLVRDAGMLAVAAFVGMVNGMGRDRGASLVLEQAILPSTGSEGERTRTFAVYNVLQDIGHAVGGLAAGLPALLAIADVDPIDASRATVGIYVLLCLVPVFLYARMSSAVEAGAGAGAARVKVTPRTRGILWRISSLFALDSLGGGFLTTALLAWFFHERFGVGEAVVAPLFFLARLANAVSHLGAAWLAKRIGLVNTMVFTHIPSSLLLVTVAIAPSFPVAAALFLLREGLVEMDVPTRQSYVMAVVRPEERTIASGVTHLVRMAAWAVAPAFAGLLAGGASLLAPLVAGAAMKIVYDLLLWRAFRNVRPPEEESK